MISAIISICMEQGRLEIWICSVIVKCNNLEIFVRWGECFQPDRFLWHCNVILLAALHFLARRIQEHRSRALVEVDRVVFQLNKYKDIQSFMPCATWAPITWVQSRSITFSKGLPSCVAPVGPPSRWMTSIKANNPGQLLVDDQSFESFSKLFATWVAFH